MFWAISILLTFSLVLLIFDHQSKLSLLFVLMAVGCSISIYSLILFVHAFGNYYFYSASFMFDIDYRMYTMLTQSHYFPLTTIIRFLNAGQAIFLLSGGLFTCEVCRCIARYLPRQRYRINIARCFLIFPALLFLLYDPRVSTQLYILNHRSELGYILLSVVQVLCLGMRFASILYLLFSLLSYMRLVRFGYLKRRILALFSCLFFLQAGYTYLFCIGRYRPNIGNVVKSGFWYFGSVESSLQFQYQLLPLVTIVLMSGCLIVLLSFRLDFSSSVLLKQRVHRNLKLMNEIQGDLLHSYKNQLLTIRIYAQKAQSEQAEPTKSIIKVNTLVDSAMSDVSAMLNNLREARFHFSTAKLSEIVDAACAKVYVPGNIELQVDRTVPLEIIGYYDSGHLQQALINILTNALEAINRSGKETGVVRVETAFFFGLAVIVVTDSGTGITRQVMRHIFTPHYSTKNGKLNWGLGMTYVYRVVKAHMGQIRIISKEGRFTSVMMLLPMVRNMGKEKAS